MTPSREIPGLAREGVSSVPLYLPDAEACAVDLSDNTNLWGPPPAALRALQEMPAAGIARYPSLYSEPLRDAILAYVGLDGVAGIDIVTGCGSDDILDSTMRAFGAPGDTIAYSAPTFSMIPALARLNALEQRAIPLTASFDVDAERLVESGAKITYLCTPNNPTATIVSRQAVEYVVANARGIVLLDEAYAEFAPETFTHLVARHERLIVARTFSKAFGLAGLRVGFGIASRSATRLIARARGPYKVNALAERAVLAALASSPDALPWMQEHAMLAIANRDRLARTLETLGLCALPSAANFILVPTPHAATWSRAMRARGVLVRAFAGLPTEIAAFAASEGAALRIGVGPWEMMETLLSTLAEVMACE